MASARLLQAPGTVPHATALSALVIRAVMESLRSAGDSSQPGVGSSWGDRAGMWGPRTLQGWATGCMWVGTRLGLSLLALWGGHGKGPHRPLLGSEARPRRHFSQDLPALQSSLNACSAMLQRFPPSFWPRRQAEGVV